jgi:hypothetical protein
MPLHLLKTYIRNPDIETKIIFMSFHLSCYETDAPRIRARIDVSNKGRCQVVIDVKLFYQIDY